MGLMRRFQTISLLALLACALALTSSATALAANPPVAPASFAGWTQSGRAQTITPASDTRWPGRWPIFQEYGFISGEVQQYSKDGKTLSVALYQMKDSSGAYGLYSFLRTPGMGRADITDHSCISDSRALILDGVTVVEITGPGLDFLKIRPDFKSLVDALGPAPAEEPYPDLFKRLPLRGFEEGTDRYILGPAALQAIVPIAAGDWAGFANGAEAEIGQYRFSGENHTVTLIVIDYPTPQVASKMLKEWEGKFNLDAQEADSKKPTIYASRKLTIVGVVSGVVSAAEAKALLSHLDSGEELTWNEPGFSLSDANINAVIASIIVGTGILCMFTLVAGLAFGGVRLVIKRVLPGRIFDRGSAMDVLQLGLASKPINSDDFYGMGKTPSPLSASRES